MSLWPNDECQILPLTDRRWPGWKLDFKGRARDLSCPEQAVPQGLVAQNRLQMSTAARRSRDARGICNFCNFAIRAEDETLKR